MIEVERGSANVYKDLGYANADEMRIKAQLAGKIADIIKQRHLTQVKAADGYVDLPAKIQEALELYFDGEALRIPAPSNIARLEATGEYVGGAWMLVDIDSRLSSRG